MNSRVNPATLLPTSMLAQSGAQSNNPTSWYEIMAEAWGRTLDSKASEIETAAQELAEGDDTPSQMTMMTALAQQMNFMSNSAHTSLQSVGTALETMARKQ